LKIPTFWFAIFYIEENAKSREQRLLRF